MTIPTETAHVLLVDDLEANLLALEALLSAEGLVPLKARSGSEALELLLRFDVALALVDVQMPETDGFELAELMRGTERTRRVPIIFLTAGSDDRGRRFRGYEAGAVDFLHKPLEPDILRGKVGVFVELYRQRQEIARQRDESRRTAAELRQSERSLAMTLEAGQLGSWDWDIPTDRVRYGGCWASMLGYRPEDIAPDFRAWARLLHPEDSERVRGVLDAHLAGASHFYECEYRLRHRDGTYRWILDRGRVVDRDRDGRPLRAIGTHADVTARKQAEEEREEARRLTRSIIDGSPAPIFAKDLEGRYVLTNRAWRQRVGGDPEQALGITDSEVFGPEVARALRANDQRVLESGAPMMFEESAVLDGQRLTFLSNKFVLADAGGRPYAVCGVSADITELKQTQAALADRERQLQSLADNTPDILCRFDRDLRLVFASAAIAGMTGQPPERLVGRTTGEQDLPAELCRAWEQELRKVFATGEPGDLAFRFETPSGPRHYTARLVPEPEPDGSVRFVLGVTHDITEQRRYEETLREQDRRKDEFLATLAHELRNPLAPIRTGLQILQETPEGAPAAGEALAMMERQLGHVVRLIDDLLDVSRISRGKIELKRRRVALRSVIDHALEANRPHVAAAGHELIVQVPGPPIWLDGDPTRLAQVIGNLLHNAAKYTPDAGRIMLSASIEDRSAVIRVTDSGVGIAADMLPKVFELFTQVPSSLDRSGGGLGIGLSLARQLVEEHGGTIEAHSDGHGRGSTFVVRLPLAEGPNPREVAAPSGRSPRPAARTPGLVVLVVDDNVDAARSLARLLKLWGHQAHLAHDGPHAIASAAALAPDLVLLDIGLPGMDGNAVCRRLRELPTLAATRIAAITGWGSALDRERTHAAGFDLHLVKPVAPEDLQALLQAASARGAAPAFGGP